MDTFSAYFLNPKAMYTQIVHLPKNSDYFSEAKKVMNIEWLTIVNLELEGHTFTVLCDDEGLLTSEIYFSIFDGQAPLIAGNVIFMHESPVDEDGNSILSDLTDEEIDIIDRNCVLVIGASSINIAINNCKYPE